MIRIPPLFIAIAAGALNVLAFAPFGWWPIQIATLAWLLRHISHESSARRAASIGWGYGFGWSACGICWLFISMHRYGGMPSWMAALAVALLAFYLSAYIALAMGCGTWLKERWRISDMLSLTLIFPALWTLAEWLRGWVLSGFPWISSGYAHTFDPLAGFAPLVGVYGLGGLAALISGCLALLPSKKLPAVCAMLIFAAGFGLKTVDWSEPSGKPISVRLLQGNIEQDLKFASEQTDATLALYDDMLRAAPADLIATPETALPVLSNQLPLGYLAQLTSFAQQSHSHLLIGIPLSDGPMQYANSAIGIAPDATVYRYDKHHLVPFGEFIPAGFRWFVDLMRIPLGDFARGPVLQAPFAVNDQWILPNICYEDLFGEEIASQLAASHLSTQPQATILLNISNIGWFGDSIALPQHLQISQMRALETARPVMRATNTGVTAVIDRKGRTSAQLPPFTRGVLIASVQGYRGYTPYVLYGNALPVAAALLMLGAAWLLSRMGRKKSRLPE